MTEDGELLGAMAHELRHVVGTLVHQVAILSRDDLTEPLRDRSLRSLGLAAADLSQLTESLGDLERLARGEWVPSPVLTDIDRVVEDVVASSAPTNGGPGVVISVEPVDDQLIVRVDPSFLVRALGLLVGEVGAGSGQVRLRARRAVPTHGREDLEVELRAGTEPTAGPCRTVEPRDGLVVWAAGELLRRCGGRVEIGVAGRGAPCYRLVQPLPGGDARPTGGDKLGHDA